MNKLYITFLVLIINLWSFTFVFAKVAQPGRQQISYDSTYITSYDKELTLRTYLSQKYTSISMGGSNILPAFRFRPNTTLNFGIGATLNSFSLNLAYGFPGLNGDASQRGKTKYLDLQSHFYSRKWVVDLFGQFYKGYYISPKNYVPGYYGYYTTPDLRVDMIGGSGYYIFNSKRFSYRAPLIQNEWQKKSAGTFLAGLSFFYGIINSDKTIIPEAIAELFPQGKVKKMRFINFGPGAGYAYTFVYKENWFATASLTANLTADFSKETNTLATEGQANASLSTNFIYRGGIGYNSDFWTFSFSIVNNTVVAQGAATTRPYVLRTGNYRITLARRLPLNKKMKEIIQPVEQIMDRE